MKKYLLSGWLVLLCVTGLLAQEKAAAENLKTQLVLDSMELAYTEAGAGEEAVLFIHGLGGNRHHWQQTLPGVSPHFRALAVDLPGYGDSRLEEVPQDSILHFFSRSLYALLDSLSISKVHLAGHSMGGQLAMLMALQYPERVQNLVLAAPAGIETFSVAEAQSLKAFAQQQYPQKLSEAQIRHNYALNFHQMPKAAEELIQERLALNESSYFPTYAKVLVKAVEGMLETPVASRLSELKVPVLLVFGQEDRLIPNRFLHPGEIVQTIAAKAKAAIPGSKLVILPEAGHLLMFEQPELFNKHLNDFLHPTNAN